MCDLPMLPRSPLSRNSPSAKGWYSNQHQVTTMTTWYHHNSKLNPSIHLCMLHMGMSTIHIQLLLTASSPSLFLMLLCQWVGWECTRSWESSLPWQQTRAGQEGYSRPYDIVAIKYQRKEEEWWIFPLTLLLHVPRLCFLHRYLDICPPVGNSE